MNKIVEHGQEYGATINVKNKIYEQHIPIELLETKRDKDNLLEDHRKDGEVTGFKRPRQGVHERRQRRR